MGDINRRYFEGLMADRRLSLRALAARMGMGHSQLSLTFSGARKLQIEEAAQLSSIFGEPIDKIVENAGVSVRPVSGRRINVVGSIGGDGAITMFGPDVVERTTAPDHLPVEICAIQARTSGTPLEWIDSWVLFCRLHNGVDPGLLGQMCVVKLRDGPAVVCTVKRGYAEGTYNLIGLYHKENAKLEWATPVLMIRP